VKRFFFVGALTAVLLALFLVLRPAVSAIGSPAVPDTAGRAKELLPEEQAGGASTFAAPPVSGPPPVAGAPLEPIEKQIVELTNEARRQAGLAPLTLDEPLRRAARNHARDMIVRGFTDSLNPDGLSADDRASHENRRAVAVVAENLGGGSPKDSALVRRVVADWLANPDDRNKILRPEYTHIGVGVMNSTRDVRAVQMLARTIAVAAEPIPEKIAAGATMRVALASSDPAVTCNAADLFAPETGLVALGPMPFGNVTMKVTPGIYKLRVRCSGKSGAQVFPGPRIEVTP
jgi:uncharacterized protein YkwD